METEKVAGEEYPALLEPQIQVVEVAVQPTLLLGNPVVLGLL